MDVIRKAAVGKRKGDRPI